MDKYAGYLYCGDCGKKLYLHRAKSIDPEKNFFQCGGYHEKGGHHCTAHYMLKKVLDEIVLHQVRKMTAYARECPEEFYEMTIAGGEEEAKKFYATAERHKTQLNNRIKELDKIIRCLYEDRVIGRISSERYDMLASGYEQEHAELRQELLSISQKIEEMDMREICIKEFMAQAKEYAEMEKLTPEMLRVFIRRIDVYEKEQKYSRTCGNPVFIHFTFQPKSQTTPLTAFLDGTFDAEKSA